jgi:hypothetical protein
LSYGTASGLELDARLTTLLCNNDIVAKCKSVKTESNLAESSKKCHGTKRTGLPMQMNREGSGCICPFRNNVAGGMIDEYPRENSECHC